MEKNNSDSPSTLLDSCHSRNRCVLALSTEGVIVVACIEQETTATYDGQASESTLKLAILSY